MREVRDLPVLLVRFAGRADGGVEGGPGLGFLLGLVEVADGQDAVGM